MASGRLTSDQLNLILIDNRNNTKCWRKELRQKQQNLDESISPHFTGGVSGNSRPDPGCDSGWEGNGDNCYLFVRTKRVTYDQAISECNAVSASPVWFTSQDELVRDIHARALLAVNVLQLHSYCYLKLTVNSDLLTCFFLTKHF